MLISSTKLKNAIDAHSNGMDLTFTLEDNPYGSELACNGFVRNNANGTVVYVNTEPTAFFGLFYMYRYADDERDFFGYQSRRANTLDELASAICACLHKTLQEVNDRRI